MFTISRATIKYHGDAARRRFCTCLHEHLRTIYADRTADLPLESVDALVDWAAHYDITRRYDVQRLAELLLEHGLMLDVVPTRGPLAEVFVRNYAYGTDRVNELVERELATHGASNE